jgi:hypothetical protein
MWIASAQVVCNMVSSHVRELEDPVTLESKSIALVEFPLYSTWKSLSGSPEEPVPVCCGVLQVGVQGLSDDEIFWFLVQEYQALLSRIMKQQQSLPSNSCHELFIYSCIRAIVSGNTVLSGRAIQLLGTKQLLGALRSVTLVANVTDSGYELSSPRRQMTEVAIEALKAENIIREASIEEKRMKSNSWWSSSIGRMDQISMYSEFHKIQG